MGETESPAPNFPFGGANRKYEAAAFSVLRREPKIQAANVVLPVPNRKIGTANLAFGEGHPKSVRAANYSFKGSNRNFGTSTCQSGGGNAMWGAAIYPLVADKKGPSGHRFVKQAQGPHQPSARRIATTLEFHPSNDKIVDEGIRQ